MKMISKIGILSVFLLGSLLHADEKIYIDGNELNTTQDIFRVHIGHNVWIETSTVHRDKSGLFTFDSCISRSATSAGSYRAGYEKSWKCPYCYHYWPIGTPCQNKDCPSRYK